MASTVSPLLMLLIMAAGILTISWVTVANPETTSTVRKWHKTRVTQATLQEAQLVKTVKGEGEVRCAVEATSDLQVTMFCTSDLHTCSLYRVMGKAEGEVDGEAGGHCWIGYDGECETDGQLRLDVGCTVNQCYRRLWFPTAGSFAPNISITELVAKNCLRILPLVIQFSWVDARTYCRQINGDLFVAGDFEGVGQLLAQLGYDAMWVGAKGGMWLDGRPVAAGEWGNQQPPAALIHSTCGSLKESKVVTTSCEKKLPFVCKGGEIYE